MAVAPDDPTFLQKLGILRDRATAPFGGAANLGMALLANSGYSTTPRSFGQVLGASALQGQQLAVAEQQRKQEKEMEEIRRRYMEAQIGALKAKPAENLFGNVNPSAFTPESLSKFQQTGSYADLVPVSGGKTSDVQNYEYFLKLSPEQQKQFMSLQRQPTVPQLSVINGVPTLVDRLNATTTPLTTLDKEISSAVEKAKAEASAKATGTAIGEAQGSIIKKGLDAEAITGIIDMADPLIDLATGSATGAAADKVAGFFGKALTGAEATAQLQIIQAALMLNQPRMEGPQGVLDVQLYERMAGELGNPTVPRSQKRAALKTIRQLQDKYKERAAGLPESGGLPQIPSEPRRIQNDADYDALPSGTVFVGPDGKQRRKP